LSIKIYKIINRLLPKIGKIKLKDFSPVAQEKIHIMGFERSLFFIFFLVLIGENPLFYVDLGAFFDV